MYLVKLIKKTITNQYQSKVPLSLFTNIMKAEETKIKNYQ